MSIVIPVPAIALYGVTVESVTVLCIYLVGTYLLETIEVTLTTVTVATTIFKGISASYCSVSVAVSFTVMSTRTVSLEPSG